MAYTHSDFELYPDHIVLDNILYPYTPAIEFIADQVAGIQRQSVLTADMSRAVSFVKPFDVLEWRTSTSIYPAGSYAFAQVMRFKWDDFITETMYDHLIALYRTQKGVWVQYDSEMSRTDVVVSPSPTDSKVYILPTYPLAYSSDATDITTDEKVAIKIKIDDVELDWATNPYRLDYERGIIRFNAAPVGVVTVTYVWRMFARVVNVDMQPITDNGGLYQGSIVLEQIKAPKQVAEYGQYISEQYKCGDEVNWFGPDVKSDTLQCLTAYVENTEDNVERICVPCTSSKFRQSDNTIIRTSYTQNFTNVNGAYTVDLSSIPSSNLVMGIRVTSLKASLASYATTNDKVYATVGMRFVATGGAYLSLNKDNLNNNRQDIALANVNTANGTPVFGGCDILYTTPFRTLTTAQIKQGLEFSAVVQMTGSASGIKPKYYLNIITSGTKNVRDSGGSPTATAIGTNNDTTAVGTITAPFDLTLTPTAITTPATGYVYADSSADITYRVVYQNPNFSAAEAGLSSIYVTHKVTSRTNHATTGSGLSGYSDFIDLPTPNVDVTTVLGSAATLYALEYTNSYTINGLIDETRGVFSLASRVDIIPHGTTSPVYDRWASINTTQEYKARLVSEINEFEVEVLHRPICQTDLFRLGTYTNQGGGSGASVDIPIIRGEPALVTTTPAYTVTGPGALNILINGAVLDSLPDYATVVGFELDLELSCSSNRTVSVNLYRGAAGAPVFTAKSAVLTSAMTNFTLGGQLDMWGVSSTVDKADLPNIGVVITGDALGSGEVLKVRNVELRIYYVVGCC